ncbi:MAG: cyanophycin synthetase, partial [Bacteroidota bacterium]
IENTLQGLLLEVEQKEIWFRLIGHFNAYNLMAVYASALLLGEEEEAILTELSNLSSAAGRFEQFGSPDGITGIVDYSHTPDALKNVLETIVQIRESSQKVFTVVGCGGDRDKEKRPKMARLAYDLSDQAIFTSDNPRSEDPLLILEDMKEGLSPAAQKEVIVIENRQEAIARACRLAKRGDIVLIAGKGHETYQEIQGKRYPFDDREMLKTYLNIED